MLKLKKKTNSSFTDRYIHFIKKVIYKDNDKIEFVKRFLIEIVKASSLDVIHYLVQTFLNNYRFIFKPESNEYELENEVRSVIILEKKESDQVEELCIKNNLPAHCSNPP